MPETALDSWVEKAPELEPARLVQVLLAVLALTATDEICQAVVPGAGPAAMPTPLK